jgi:hypothetical protein
MYRLGEGLASGEREGREGREGEGRGEREGEDGTQGMSSNMGWMMNPILSLFLIYKL